jgi:hypothetical protein
MDSPGGYQSVRRFVRVLRGACCQEARVIILDYHLKTGHTLSLQNRPTEVAEDVIVLPCRSVRLQGLGLSPRSGVCYCGFALPGSRPAE